MVNSGRRTLAELFSEAEARIERLAPVDAAAAMDEGAILVDIRSEEDRRRDGVVPGALHVPRTVLEWRLDPESEWRTSHVGGLDSRIVLLCDHGFSSVLAAASLVDLGFTQAGDVVGGFAAWRAAGLPVQEAPPIQREPGELAGMRPPEPSQTRPAGMAVRNLDHVEAFTTKDGSRIRELLGLSTSALVRNQSLAEATLEPGQATERHYHRESEEIYFLLAGGGEMEIDGESRSVGPGDAVLIPPGARHTLLAGPEGARLLCCCAPPYRHEDTFLD